MTGEFELGTDGPTVVVTGVDGSRTSLRAAAYAAGLARRQHARLVVVHVGEASGMEGLVPGLVAPAAEARHDLAEDLRQQARLGAQWAGLHVEYQTVEGDPYAELTRIAQEVRAELIVVGASEAKGHRLVGSLAVRLVRAGKWPVTVVP